MARARSGQRLKWLEDEVAKGSVIGQGEGIGIAKQWSRQGGWSERRAEPTLGWSHRHEHGSWRSLSGFTLIVAVPRPTARRSLLVGAEGSHKARRCCLSPTAGVCASLAGTEIGVFGPAQRGRKSRSKRRRTWFAVGLGRRVMFYNTWPVGTRSGHLAWRHHPGPGRWQWDGVIGDVSCRAHDDDSAPTVGSALRLPHLLYPSRWLAMQIFAPLFSFANHRTFGHLVLWPLRALATSTSGHSELGHFNLWPLPALATSTSGLFVLWPLWIHPVWASWPLLANSTSGQYELEDLMNSWTLWTLAKTTSGRYESLDFMIRTPPPPPPAYVLHRIIDSSQRGRTQNLTCNLPIARFIAFSVPPQRYLHSGLLFTK